MRTFFCEAMDPRLKSSPRLMAFPSDNGRPTPWQLWPSGFLDMSLHMEGKMVRPGKTPREDKKNKDIREICIKNSTSITPRKMISPKREREAACVY